MTTGERMKSRRKELGLSAERVADQLGCSPATIYRYEKGDIEKMPLDILAPLASILKTTAADLMGWSVKWEDDIFDDFWHSNDETRILIFEKYGIPDSLISEANRLGLNTKPSADNSEGLDFSDMEMITAYKNADDSTKEAIQLLLKLKQPFV